MGQDSSGPDSTASDRYRLLTDHLPGLFSVVDRDHRYTYVNLAYAEMVGMPREAIVGRPMRDVIGDDIYARLEPHITEALGGTAQQVEIAIERDGVDRRLLGKLVPHEFDDGDTTEIIVLVTDVTATRQTEHELRSAQEKFSLLAEHATDLIWTTDLGLRFTFVSPSSMDLLGYRPDELEGQTVGMFMTQPSFDEAMATLAQKVHQTLEGDAQGWEPVVIQLEVLPKAGDAITVRTHARLVRGHDGQPAFVAGVSHDISDRLREERERDSLRDQLFQAQKMEAIGRLAGGIAHDFGNALSVIKCNAEIAREEVGEGGYLAELLIDIESAASHAANLTNQLLAFARRQAAAPQSVRPSDVLQRLEPLLARVLGSSIVLTLDVSGAHAKVVIDPVQLEQVTLNLVINARDAMPQGGTLAVRLVDVVEDGAPTGCRMVVEDSGMGIPKDLRDQIFEPFFTTKEDHRGTGLGLSSVRGIVEQNRGTVSVASEVGRGTTFTIELPADPEATAASAAASRAEGNASHGTVLVVDDERMLVSLGQKLLTRLGYDVLTAGSGEDALAVAKTHDGVIDLLFTDVVMPEMGGYELAEKLRAERPGLRVLFTSGYVDDLDQHHLALGAGDHFIAKPYAMDRLARSLRESLEDEG